MGSNRDPSLCTEKGGEKGGAFREQREMRQIREKFVKEDSYKLLYLLIAASLCATGTQRGSWEGKAGGISKFNLSACLNLEPSLTR